MAPSKFITQVADALIPILCSIEPHLTGLRAPRRHVTRVADYSLFASIAYSVRARGKAGTHVTKHVAALRLMYWESTTGDLEFANVGPKGELVIEPGEASRATTIDYPEADVA